MLSNNLLQIASNTNFRNITKLSNNADSIYIVIGNTEFYQNEDKSNIKHQLPITMDRIAINEIKQKYNISENSDNNHLSLYESFTILEKQEYIQKSTLILVINLSYQVQFAWKIGHRMGNKSDVEDNDDENSENNEDNKDNKDVDEKYQKVLLLQVDDLNVPTFNIITVDGKVSIDLQNNKTWIDKVLLSFPAISTDKKSFDAVIHATQKLKVLSGGTIGSSFIPKKLEKTSVDDLSKKLTNLTLSKTKATKELKDNKATKEVKDTKATESKVGNKDKKTTPKTSSSKTMIEEGYVINPKTNRKVKIGSKALLK